MATAPTESFTTVTPAGGRALNYALRKPVGVVAIIVPWNLPLLLLTWKVAPALACGNTVVVKPSEETPASATLLAEVMAAAGVPAGVFNLVHGFGPDSAGEFLTRHPDVDAITFTGESATGSTIMKAAADGVKAVSFELGGKNAGLVFADADLDAAVAGSRAVELHQRRSGLPLHRAPLRAAPGLRRVRGAAGRARPGSWRTAGPRTRRRRTCR